MTWKALGLTSVLLLWMACGKGTLKRNSRSANPTRSLRPPRASCG